MDDEFSGVPVGAVCTCEKSKNTFEELKDSPLVNEEPKEVGALRIATLNVLTLNPAEESEVNGLRIPAREARLASTFEDAANEVIGLQECRLPAQLVVRESFVMVTSEAEDGRDGCGLWLSTPRVGREHLTVVHSSPLVLMVAVRSKTIETNVVVAHWPVEGHERAEARWMALGETLTASVDDVPMYVCIDANGRLGSSTSKHVGSVAAEQKTPQG